VSSPIVDVRGNPYPSSIRRRVTRSPWWRLRYSLLLLAANLTLAVLMQYLHISMNHQFKEIIRLAGEIQRTRGPCQIAGYVK
jgi:hypothetical protein